MINPASEITQPPPIVELLTLTESKIPSPAGQHIRGVGHQCMHPEGHTDRLRFRHTTHHIKPDGKVLMAFIQPGCCPGVVWQCTCRLGAGFLLWPLWG